MNQNYEIEKIVTGKPGMGLIEIPNSKQIPISQFLNPILLWLLFIRI